MAHELSFTNGQANVLSVRQTPWHKEGVVLDNPPTLAEALRMAGLDYKVEKRPTFRAIETGIAGLVEYKQNADAWITFRPDTGASLAPSAASTRRSRITMPSARLSRCYTRAFLRSRPLGCSARAPTLGSSAGSTSRS